MRTLTVFNPARKNALTRVMLASLASALAEAPASTRAIVVRGAGQGSFCAGYDLNELRALRPGDVQPDEHVAEVFDGLTGHRAPSVAVVTGPAFGAGCELALACDLRVGSPAATFCLPPLKLGLVYGVNGMRRMAARVGEQTVRSLVLTGATVDANRALQLGLLDSLEPTADAAEAAGSAQAAQWAKVPPGALEGTRAALSLLSLDPASAEFARRQARYDELHRASFEPSDLARRLDALKPR